jgi:glycine/D-amino acid oxidase-like deaminating enzyme
VFNVADSDVAVLDYEAGYLDPEQCVAAYRALAERRGAQLHYGEAVLSWRLVNRNLPSVDNNIESNSGGANQSGDRANTVEAEEGSEEVYEVVTSLGRVVYCRQLVLAVGAWAPELYGAQLPLRQYVERRVLYWMQPTDGHQAFQVHMSTAVYMLVG